MSPKKPRIAVIGSYAVGMTMSCGIFPREGETVMGHGFQMLHGGKGSNQAIAVARLGGASTFMTAVGADSFGEDAVEMLQREEVDTRFVQRMSDASTAVGFVVVAENGNNEIVIDLGANRRLLPGHVDLMADAIASSDLLLVQLEINKEAVIHAIDLARAARVPVILNPAPFQPLPEETVSKVTYVTPNETEAAGLLGDPSMSVTDGRALAEAIHRRYGIGTIVTLGAQGAFVRTSELSELVPTFRARVVDTTGAGDTFSAALAVALGEGQPVVHAARFAAHAASLSVEVPGVVPSIPYRSAVDAKLASA